MRMGQCWPGPRVLPVANSPRKDGGAKLPSPKPPRSCRRPELPSPQHAKVMSQDVIDKGARSQHPVSARTSTDFVQIVAAAEEEGLMVIVTDPALNKKGENVDGVEKAYKNHDVLCGHPGDGAPIKGMILTKKGREVVRGKGRPRARIELLLKDEKTIARFKETFLKRNGFHCFNLEGSKWVRAPKCSWFHTDAWVFDDFQGILRRRQGAQERKKKPRH